MKQTRLKLFYCALAVLASAFPQRGARAAELMATLDTSGWTVLTQADPGAALVQLQIIVRSGSLSDPANESGLASFTARAMLRGTQTRPYQELSTDLESLGATISVSVDTTQTVFSVAVPPANLDACLDVLSDVFTHPAFDVTQTSTLQKVLFGELADDLQDTRTLAARAVLQTAYAGTSLQNPIKGTVASVSTLTPQEALSFFQTHYVRENMLVGVTNPFTNGMNIVSDFETQMNTVPHGALDAPVLPASVLQGQGIQAVIVNRPGLSVSSVYVAAQGLSDSDPNWLALDLGDFVFGGGPSCRLEQTLVTNDGLVDAVSSGYSQILHPKGNGGLYSVYLDPSPANLVASLNLTLGMLQSYAASGITPTELVAAQSALSNSYPFQIATAEDELAQAIRQQITGHPALTAAQFSAEVAALTQAQVNAAIAAKLDVQDLVIVAVGDATVLQPMMSTLTGVKSVTVVQVNP